MNKTLKKRKAPTHSATKYNIGTRKKGNDGNIWKVVKNKNNIKRWVKVSNTKKLEKNIENVWGKNKSLEDLWRKLSSGEEVVLIYGDDKVKKIKMPKTINATLKKYDVFKKDDNIKAIITSAQSDDIYEALYKKVKNKKPELVIKNYGKYLTNYGDGDKIWYL